MPNIVDRVATLETQQAVQDTVMATMNTKLDKLVTAVVEGNGKPALITRVDRLERGSRFRAAWLWLFASALVSCGVSAAFAHFSGK